MKAAISLLSTLLLLLCGSAVVQGQTISDTDSLWIDSIGTLSGESVVLDVFFVNEDTLHGVEIPLYYSSPDIIIDSVSLADSRISLLTFTFYDIYPAESKIHIGAMDFDGTSMVLPGRGKLASLYITLPPTTPTQLIEFDTTYIPPTSHVSFISKIDESYTPQFRKGYINNSISTDITSGNDLPLPTEFYLAQNHPNPFNPTTDISFALPRKSRVRLEIYNLLGQQVRSLLDDELMSGQHTITFDGRDNEGRAIASGVYFYRIKTAEDVQTRKMVMIK
ncbi:MAG: T9SS type A sorting domain-containing protein [FCB group bacterium]|nr:T9SS type A sorting domain-containing protein [FCB group bacterium]